MLQSTHTYISKYTVKNMKPKNKQNNLQFDLVKDMTSFIIFFLSKIKISQFSTNTEVRPSSRFS